MSDDYSPRDANRESLRLILDSVTPPAISMHDMARADWERKKEREDADE